MKAREAKTWITLSMAAALLLVSAAWWPRPIRADWRSLTGPLPAYVSRIDYQISPDSKMVAFTADLDTDDVVELYPEPITGTHPIKLNPPLVKNGEVFTFLFTPDSQSILYLADQEVDNRFELYSVPVTGGEAKKLNG